MKILYSFLVGCLLIGLGSASPLAAQMFKKPKFSLDNPLVKSFVKESIEQYLPQVTGKSEKIKDITFQEKKKSDATVAVKANVLFENPNAGLGNGNYRVKFRIAEDLLKPKIHYLKMQVVRIWFIRFYKRVI
jgi:hypothetical protein